MPLFFLPQQHNTTLDELPDGRFITEEELSSWEYQIPFGCVPAWCEYIGDWVDDHAWENQRTGEVRENIHPMGLKMPLLKTV
jgi:hypothetical protein